MDQYWSAELHVLVKKPSYFLFLGAAVVEVHCKIMTQCMKQWSFEALIESRKR